MNTPTISRDPADIPDYMMNGLRRYIDFGVLPGDFLTAVLENDLSKAVGKADATNIALLRAYVIFLYNHAPAGCWGSPEKVNAWIQMRVDERLRANGLTGEPA